MASNDYHFITKWKVEASQEELYDLILDSAQLPRWWPSVYLKAEQREKGEPNGVGKVIDLHTKGWLPYTLRWSFKVTEAIRPKKIVLEAWGDFVGRGIWEFFPGGEVTFDWKLSAEKPLLRSLSPVL